MKNRTKDEPAGKLSRGEMKARNLPSIIKEHNEWANRGHELISRLLQYQGEHPREPDHRRREEED